MASGKPSATSVTWLHLSDLHMNPQRFNQGQVVRTLVDDLRQMEHEYQLQPDVIFFTGDLVSGGTSSRAEAYEQQFHSAQQFIDKVRTAFAQPIPLDRVFLVPGNHDVDRSMVSDEQTRYSQNPSDDEWASRMIAEGGIQWLRYMDRLKTYSDFLQETGYAHLLQDPKRLTYGQVIDIRGVHLGVAGFNSAWGCCRQGERGQLWLGGDWQINHLEEKVRDADIKVALIHHPTSWIVESEARRFGPDVEREFHFCLHGHDHTDWITNSNGHVRVAAAACYQHPEKENGYNFVRLDAKSSTGTAWLRAYDRKGNGWVMRPVATYAPKGEWPIAWRIPTANRDRPSASGVRQTLRRVEEILAQNHQVSGNLEELRKIRDDLQDELETEKE